MLSILTSHPPRTRSMHLQTLRLDDGASMAWFEKRTNFANSQHALIVAINRLPPALHGDGDNSASTTSGGKTSTAIPSYPGLSNSSLGPPLHYHITQDETFAVTQGKAVFYTFPLLGAWTVPSPRYCKADVLSAGQTIKIPKGVVHTFRNASSQHSMEVEFVLDPPISTRSDALGDGHVEETFFRNTWSYRADVKAAGMERSLLQVMCFNRPPGVVLMMPGCGAWVSWVLGVIGASIGRWVWGYRSVYDEYASATKGPSSKMD